MSSDKSERDDASTGDQPKGDNPFIADRIDAGSDKRNCDNQMSERELVSAVGKKGIVGVRRGEPFVDTFDPRKEMGGSGNWPQ
jgi:hypothetical protein